MTERIKRFPKNYEAQKALLYEECAGFDFVMIQGEHEVSLGSGWLHDSIQEAIQEQIKLWEGSDNPQEVPNYLNQVYAVDDAGTRTQVSPQLIEECAKKAYQAEWFYYVERFEKRSDNQRPAPDEDFEYLVEIGRDNSDDLLDLHRFLHNNHIQLVVNGDYYPSLIHSDCGMGLEDKTLVNGDEADFQIPAGKVKRNLVLFELPQNDHLLMLENRKVPSANTIGCFVMPEDQQDILNEHLKYYVEHLQRYLTENTWAWEIWKDEISVDYAGRFATPREALADFLSKFNARDYQIIYDGQDITFDIHDQLNCDIGAESQAESIKKKARSR